MYTQHDSQFVSSKTDLYYIYIIVVKIDKLQMRYQINMDSHIYKHASF